MQAMKRKRRTELESVILPVILLLTGLVLVGGDRAGVLSLDRIQNLWPVAILLVGLSDVLTNGGEENVREYPASDSSRKGSRLG
jgi:hypothetical protein